jgi:hypothetical protein
MTISLYDPTLRMCTRGFPTLPTPAADVRVGGKFRELDMTLAIAVAVLQRVQGHDIGN